MVSAVGLLLALEGTSLVDGLGDSALEVSGLVSTGVVASLLVSRPDSHLGNLLGSTEVEEVLARAELLLVPLISLGSSDLLLATDVVHPIIW